jgi:5-methylcytosine-specific restriction endonuclease McrA
MDFETENWETNKRRVKEIYGGCAVCGTDIKLTVHHIIRRSEWEQVMGTTEGVNRKSNLIPLCEGDHEFVEWFYDEKDGVNKTRVYLAEVKKEKQDARNLQKSRRRQLYYR